MTEAVGNLAILTPIHHPVATLAIEATASLLPPGLTVVRSTALTENLAVKRTMVLGQLRLNVERWQGGVAMVWADGAEFTMN